MDEAVEKISNLYLVTMVDFHILKTCRKLTIMEFNFHGINEPTLEHCCVFGDL